MGNDPTNYDLLLEHYSDVWFFDPVEGAARIEGVTSVLYPVIYQGAPAMLKLPRPATDEEGAAAALQFFDGEGIARLYQHDVEAMLVERLDNDISLEDMCRQGHEEEAVSIIASVAAKLHNQHHRTAPHLLKLETSFRSLLWRGEREKAGGSIYGQAADMARRLLGSQQDVMVLHGDIHHGNIIHDKARGWLAIDPKGVIGERTYDLANLFCNPDSLPQLVLDAGRMRRIASQLAARLQLDMRRLLQFAFVHACLSACWMEDAGGDPSFRLNCAKILAEMAH